MSADLAPRLSHLVRPLVTPAVFDFWTRELGLTLAWNRTLARVIARQVEAQDHVTLVLQPNGRFQGFRPGQHVNVTVAVDGVRLTRSYSLTDVPQRDGTVALTVKRIDGGKVSTQLCTRTQVGDVLELGPAFGALTLPDPLPNRLLFLAAGSCITPLMSLTRALAAQAMPVPLTLVYWARHRAELCYAEELRALAVRYPRFQFHVVLTREPVRLSTERFGRPSVSLLAAMVPDLGERTVYACGPGGFVASVRDIVAPVARGFQAEAFTPLSSATTTETGTVRVTLAASQQTLELPTGQPLLTALEAAGVHPPSGCRMGVCHTCVCRKLEGTTQDLHTGDVQTEADTALRLCVSTARSDLILEL